MKYFYFLSIFIILSFSIFAQTAFDAYKAEEDGYYVNNQKTNDGFVFTDNYSSAIYLLKNGNVSVLIQSVGCGRYFTVSPDKQFIGYKHIYPDGSQAPAIYEIATGKIKDLHNPVKLCGQVSFSNNGKIAFTIENDLVVISNGIAEQYNLGTYSNLAPISPDGQLVIFNDNNDQLSYFNLLTNELRQFTDNAVGYLYPLWSPDGSKIIFSDMTGILYSYQFDNNKTFTIGQGLSAKWHDNSENIVFHKSIVNDFKFEGSDIYVSKFDGTEQAKLTNTQNVSEMQPFTDGNKIYYNTYNTRKFFNANFSLTDKSISSQTLLFEQNTNVNIQFYNIKTLMNDKAINKIPGVVPYVHQVYDTPTFHAGWGSCAPTTSIMAIAYFNLLPKWTTEIDHGKSWDPHTNDYGSYVADRYRFREIYYQETADAYGTTAYGGYGYMWTGSYSPNSRMRQYLENHGLTSNQLWTTSCAYSNTIAEIDLGFPHPICNYLTSSGHLTLATGYVQNQHTLIFSDPYGDKNTPGYPSYDGQNAYYDWPGYNNGYQNLAGTSGNGYVAWTVKARGSEPAYNDTIIDDTYYNHGFYMFNQPPSHQRYFRSQLLGYNGHTWWTGSMASGGDVCYTTWTPNLPENGNYEVLAYIPSNYATASGAKYKINHNGGDTIIVINQSIYSDKWVSLGIYPFTQGQGGSVYLGDETGVASDYLAFDAMWFHKIAPEVQITVNNVSCFGLSDGTVTATISSGQAPYNYLWSNGGISASLSNLSAGTYSVTVTDSNSQQFTGSATISEPSVLIMNSTIVNPSYSGGNNGSISLNVQGGILPYSYIWNPSVSSTSSATNLVAGAYSITASDNNLCQAISSITLSDPTCDAPTNLIVYSINSSSSMIQWNSVSNSISYLLKYKRNSDSNWNIITTTQNQYFLSGLAANTLYDISVATICVDDTSIASMTSFTTLIISNQVATSCSGKFTDSGGENGVYADNENYTFTISPTGASQISIFFTDLNIELNYDTLWVFDGASVASPLIAFYTGVKDTFTIVSTGSSLTFKFWTDYATTKSGWIANWTSYGGDCNILPSTAINTLSQTWQSTNFDVSFSDTDNSGSGLNEEFYLVSDFNGTDWYANNLNGFFNDNFDTNYNSDWQISAGQWNVTGGNLIQTDLTSTNTDMYVPLAQDSNYSYLYNFKMKILDNPSSTTERAGLYIFADDPTGVERGNSYLIWFRPYEKKIQLWENINNVDYLRTYDYYNLGFDTWVDVKYIYNPQTGMMKVYLNNVLSTYWIDSNPLQTGGYISFRTTNCNINVDNINVYKSRIDNQNITIGDSLSNVRFQNASPSSPSSKISSLVIDNMNFISEPDSLFANIDWTAPSNILSVNDGLTIDIDTTNSISILSANWSKSTDENSDIAQYWFAIGTSPGLNNIHDWIPTGLDTSVSATCILALTNDTTYYFSVIAENNAGLFSDTAYSDGQLAVLNPEIIFYSDNTVICRGDSLSYINNSKNASSYIWIFEGGNPYTSNDFEPIVNYDTSGVFNVTLIATGVAGTDTLVLNSYVTVNPLTVSEFSVYDSTLNLPSAVAIFSNLSQNSSSYLWNFGDGATSTDQNPYHIYTTVGNYTITLISYSNDCENDTIIKENYIAVDFPILAEKISDNNFIKIFPNPAKNKVFIENNNSENYQIKLVDITGREISVKAIEISNKLSVIDLEKLPVGTYTLLFFENNSVILSKILTIVE